MRRDPMSKVARSRVQEDRVAALFGGYRNPGSGSLPILELKGDVRKSDVLIECKYTEASSFSVKRAILEKARREALAIRKKYWLDVEFQGTVPTDVLGAYVVIDRDDFAEVYEQFDQDRRDVPVDVLLRGLVRHVGKDVLVEGINNMSLDAQQKKDLLKVLR